MRGRRYGSVALRLILALATLTGVTGAATSATAHPVFWARPASVPARGHVRTASEAPVPGATSRSVSSIVHTQAASGRSHAVPAPASGTSPLIRLVGHARPPLLPLTTPGQPGCSNTHRLRATICVASAVPALSSALLWAIPYRQQPVNRWSDLRSSRHRSRGSSNLSTQPSGVG